MAMISTRNQVLEKPLPMAAAKSPASSTSSTASKSPEKASGPAPKGLTGTGTPTANQAAAQMAGDLTTVFANA